MSITSATATDRHGDDAWLGGSEMARRVRAFDWSATPIGPLEHWPASLRTAAAICLNSRLPSAVAWGPGLNCIYNDAHRDLLWERHPGALGLPARSFLHGSWEVLGPRLRSVIETGAGGSAEDVPLVFDRFGSPAIGFFTYSYSLIPDDDGAAGGVLVVFQDTTARVNSDRRADLLRRLTGSVADTVSDGEICLRAAEELEGSIDLPWTAIYLLEPDGRQVVRVATSGALDGDAELRRTIGIDDADDPAAAVLRSIADASAPGRLADVDPFLARAAPVAVPERVWVGPIRRGPVAPSAGFVLAGVNGRLTFDDPYRGLLELVAGQLGRAVGTARATDAERRATGDRELRTLLDELRRAQRRIAAAGDKERRRIERDLHDGAQQRLVALQFELGLLEEQLEGGPPAVHEQLGRLRGELDEALTELRELAHGVYPPLLLSDGLVAAVSAAARRVPAAVSVSARDVGPLPRDVAAAAYFCCLEALQNVAKHAGPDARAIVRLEVVGGALRFRVEDDGAGFDPRAVAGGQGLVNLRDRLAAVGGTAAVDSCVGRGTVVTGLLPLA